MGRLEQATGLPGLHGLCSLLGGPLPRMPDRPLYRAPRTSVVMEFGPVKGILGPRWNEYSDVFRRGRVLLMPQRPGLGNQRGRLAAGLCLDMFLEGGYLSGAPPHPALCHLHG